MCVALTHTHTYIHANAKIVSKNSTKKINYRRYYVWLLLLLLHCVYIENWITEAKVIFSPIAHIAKQEHIKYNNIMYVYCAADNNTLFFSISLFLIRFLLFVGRNFFFYFFSFFFSYCYCYCCCKSNVVNIYESRRFSPWVKAWKKVCECVSMIDRDVFDLIFTRNLM